MRMVFGRPRDVEFQALEGPEDLKQRTWRRILWDGPVEPRELQVTEFFRPLQRMPERIVNSVPPWKRSVALVLFWGIWLLANVLLSREGLVCISYEHTKGQDEEAARSAAMESDPIPLLSCNTNPQIWKGPEYRCGLNAQDCIDSLEVGTKLSFRCPSGCKAEGRTFSPWQVGNHTAMREVVVIGGPEIYRGDSFICGAALHAGIISQYTGGSGRLEWVGPYADFPSSPGVGDNRVVSQSFDAEFPLNFRFVDKEEDREEGDEVEQVPRACTNHQLGQTALNVVFILMGAYFIPAASSPILYLGTLAVFGFWTVFLGSNPPFMGGSSELNAELVSEAFRRLVPCLLGLVYIYQFATKPQLKAMHASLSRLVFWGGGYVCGILENFVFDSLPLDRLIISDLNSQPGAWLALAILVAVLSIIIVGQAYSFWLCGKFRKYLKAYLGIIAMLVVLGLWPGETLRLHHWFFALLLLPGTCLQTTCSLFYQGLLVGLYVAGISRWDFDSILQTAAQLSRGAAIAGSLAAPKFLPPTSDEQQFMINWQHELCEPTSAQELSYSLLINDIEAAKVWPLSQAGDDGLLKGSFNLTAWAFLHERDVRQKLYVRIATETAGRQHSLEIGEYTAPLIIEADGSYTLPN